MEVNWGRVYLYGTAVLGHMFMVMLAYFVWEDLRMSQRLSLWFTAQRLRVVWALRGARRALLVVLNGGKELCNCEVCREGYEELCNRAWTNLKDRFFGSLYKT